MEDTMVFQEVSITRRQCLRRLSAGAALAAVGALSACAGPAAAPPAAPTQAAASAKPAAPAAPAAAPAAAPGATQQAAPAAPAGGAPKGTVTVVQGPEIRTLDATLEVALAFRNAIFHLYDPLFYRDEKMRPAPHLATGFEVLDEGKRLRLKLRPNVKFHDGTTF